MVIVNQIMDLKEVTTDAVQAILKQLFRVLLVTKDEQELLNASGLRSKMPENWDGQDPYARYRSLGIRY